MLPKLGQSLKASPPMVVNEEGDSNLTDFRKMQP